MKRFCLVVLMLVLVGVPLSAQTAIQEQPAKAATDLTVEISYSKNRPTYIPGNRSMWFVNFGRIPGWQPPANFLPVRAVDVSSQAEGEATLRIKVAIRQGERYHDQETLVATYVARENEKIIVEELKQFGIMPIELRVVRTKLLAIALPYVESRASALEFTGIQRLDAPFPSYAVRLRNLSGKDIAALQVYYFTEKNERSSQRPQQQQNQPLIKAGEVYELNARGGNDGEMTAEGYAPDALQKVTVATVIFMDGTFEGEPLPAAGVNALWHGRKVQLTRALSLLRNALQSPDVDTAVAVARFKAQVAALGEDVESRSLDALTGKFPALSASGKSELRDSVRFELHRIKSDLLGAVAKFESAHAQSPEKITFRLWLESVRENYEKWIGRL